MVKTDSDEDARDFNGSKLLINEKEITPSTVVSVSDVKPVGAKVVFMLEDVRKRLPIEVQFIDKDFEVPHDVYKQSQIRRCLNNEKNLDDLSAVQTFSLFKDFIYSFFYELFHCRWKHAAEDLTLYRIFKRERHTVLCKNATQITARKLTRVSSTGSLQSGTNVEQTSPRWAKRPRAALHRSDTQIKNKTRKMLGPKMP